MLDGLMMFVMTMVTVMDRLVTGILREGGACE